MANGDAIGEALIEIQPDFSQFEAQLTRGIQDAITKAQKNAIIKFNMDSSAKSTKGMEQNISNMQGSSAELNRTLERMNRTLSNLNRNMQQGQGRARGIVDVFSSLVIIASNFANAIRGVQAGVKFFQTFQARMNPAQQSLFATANAFDRVRLTAKIFFKTLTDVSGEFAIGIKNNKNFSRAVTETGKSFGTIGSGVKNFANRFRSSAQVTVDHAKASNTAARANLVLGTQVSRTASIFSRFKDESGAANVGLLTGANAVKKLAAAFAGLGTGAGRGAGAAFSKLTGFFSRSKGEIAATTDGLGRFNRILFRVADGIRVSSNSLSRFSLASRIARKTFQTLAVGAVKNMDDVAAAIWRANNAVSGGGIFGGARFAADLSTTIALTAGLTTVMVGAAGAIIGLAQKASTAAESLNAVAVTLGDAGPAFETLIGDSTKLGLSGNKLRTSITPIVPLLKNAGLSGDELAGSLNELIRRGVDLSSIFNNDVSQSLGAIAAGIRGEIEPLERLGVAFNANEVEAKAAALGFEKVDGQLSESAKQYARLEIIMEKSAFAQGDFERTSDSLANAQRILGASFDDLLGKISKAFLPAAQKLVQVFLKLVEENGPTLEKFFTMLEPLLVRYAELFEELANIASKTGQIFANILLPSLSSVANMLNFVAPVVTAFFSKFFVLKVITITLHTFSGALAALLPKLMGASVAVGALATSMNSFLKPLALVFLAMGIFNQITTNTSSTLLGGFGRALKFIEPLLRVLLFNFLALKAVPLVIGAINVALGQLRGGLALTATQTTFITGALKRLALPIAIATTAMSLMGASTADTTELLEAMGKTTDNLALHKLVEFGEGLDFSTKAQATIKNFIPNFIDQLTHFGSFDSADDYGEAIADRTIKAFEEAFEADPIRAADLVNEAEAQRLPIAEKLRAKLTALTAAEEAHAQAMRTSADVIKERLALEKAMSDAFHESTNLIDSFISAGEGVDSANKALASANKGLASANKGLATTTKALSEIEEERARILKDTISPQQEIIDGQEALLRVGWRLRDLEQSRIELLEQITELQTPASADELAAADRAVERAKIALNRAIREEAEALKEVNKEEAIQVDLTGLSLDEIRVRLATARKTLATQKATTKDKDKEGKTQEEIDEEALTNRLDTLDAGQALRDAEEQREEIQNRVLDNTIKIRELEESLLELAVDKEDALVDQATANEHLNDLKRGETTLSAALLALEDKKKAAMEAQQAAMEAQAAAAVTVREAGDAVTLALLAQDVARFAILGKTREQLEAEEKVLGFKAGQLDLDKQDLAVLKDKLAFARLQAAIPLQAPPPGKNLIPEALVGTGFEHLVTSPLLGGDLAQRAIKAMALALLETQELKTFITGGGARAQFQGGLIEGVPGPMGQLMRAGEHGYSELVLPFQRDPMRSANLLAKFAPEVASMVRPTTLQAAPSPVRISPARQSYVSPNKPSRTEQRMERLITAIEAGNNKTIEVNAPITVSSPDSELAAKRAVRELKKFMDDI